MGSRGCECVCVYVYAAGQLLHVLTINKDNQAFFVYILCYGPAEESKRLTKKGRFFNQPPHVHLPPTLFNRSVLDAL